MCRKRTQARWWILAVILSIFEPLNLVIMKLHQLRIRDVSHPLYEPIMSTKVREVSECVVFAIAFISLILVASSSFAALHHHHHAYHSTSIIGPPHIGSVHCVYGCPIGNNILGVVVHQLINYFLWSYPWYRWYCCATGLEEIWKWKYENVMSFQLPFLWMNVDPFFIWLPAVWNRQFTANCWKVYKLSD